MEVADLTAEEQSPDKAQHRVAEVAMQRWHRAWRDPAPEPVAHDQVGAGAQPGQKRHQRREVVAVISIAHDHVPALAPPHPPHPPPPPTPMAPPPPPPPS